MDADGCLLSGAFQDHLLGFQVMTILTGQSHISKVRVIVLYQVSKCTFDVVLKIISLETVQGGTNYFIFLFLLSKEKEKIQYSPSLLKIVEM